MTDKVQKIKDWISKEQDGLMDAQGNFEYQEHEGAYHILCNLDAYIDSLQEEVEFKVGDTLRRKSDGCHAKVIEVRNGNVRVESADWDMWILNKEWELVEEPVSEGLEEELSKLLKECEVDAEYVHQDFLHIVARHFANWQKDKDFQYVKKECERTGGCCDNDIAIEAAKRHPYYYASEMEACANIGFKEGANWQREQMMKDSVLCGVDGWFINNKRNCRKNGRFHKYYVSTITHDKPLPMENGKDYRLIVIKKG